MNYKGRELSLTRHELTALKYMFNHDGCMIKDLLTDEEMAALELAAIAASEAAWAVAWEKARAAGSTGGEAASSASAARDAVRKVGISNIYLGSLRGFVECVSPGKWKLTPDGMRLARALFVSPSPDNEPSKTRVNTRGTTKKTSQQIEHMEQVKLFNLVRAYENQYPKLKQVYAVPNQAAWQRMGYYRAEGLRKGTFDINVDVSKSVQGECFYHGLRIEMKAKNPTTDRKGYFTEEQAVIAKQHIEHGYLVFHCYSCDDAWRSIKAYLDLPEGLG